MEDDPEIVKYRAELKAKLKKEFLRTYWNPKSHGEGGHVFDPAVQRYMSMKASQYDYFKPTKKTAFRGILVVLPFFIFGFIVKRSREYWEEKISTGQIAYRDRFSRFG